LGSRRPAVSCTVAGENPAAVAPHERGVHLHPAEVRRVGVSPGAFELVDAQRLAGPPFRDFAEEFAFGGGGRDAGGFADQEADGERERVEDETRLHSRASLSPCHAGPSRTRPSPALPSQAAPRRAAPSAAAPRPDAPRLAKPSRARPSHARPNHAGHHLAPPSPALPGHAPPGPAEPGRDAPSPPCRVTP